MTKYEEFLKELAFVFKKYNGLIGYYGVLYAETTEAGKITTTEFCYSVINKNLCGEIDTEDD